MLERFLDFLVVKPEVNHLVKTLRKEGFAIACSTGLKSDGTFFRTRREEKNWWEDIKIYDITTPHYESDLPGHRRSYLTDKLSDPLNQPPFNEVPVARVIVSRARFNDKGVIIGPAKLGRPGIYLHDSYFGNVPSMLERLQRVADKTFIPIMSPVQSDRTDNSGASLKIK